MENTRLQEQNERLRAGIDQQPAQSPGIDQSAISLTCPMDPYPPLMLSIDLQKRVAVSSIDGKESRADVIYADENVIKMFDRETMMECDRERLAMGWREKCTAQNYHTSIDRRYLTYRISDSPRLMQCIITPPPPPPQI
jgi:hypothetical protein